MRGSVGARRQRIPPDTRRYHPTPGAPGRTGAPAQPCAGMKLKTELEPGRYCVVEGLTLFTARPRLSAPPTARCRDFPRVSLTDGSAWARGPHARHHFSVRHRRPDTLSRALRPMGYPPVCISPGDGAIGSTGLVLFLPMFCQLLGGDPGIRIGRNDPQLCMSKEYP